MELRSVGVNASREQIRERIHWLLGNAPAVKVPQAEIKTPTRADAPLRVAFDNGLSADVYYPPGVQPADDRKLPAVLWLGSFNTSAGYKHGPGTPGDLAQDFLPRAGFVVMSYDPIGTRDRHEERRVFYDKHPDWSLLGKMVQDARDALSGLARCPDVDPDRIFVVGYAMGGMVTSFVMALDDRPAGAAIIAGFTPFRTDTDSRGTGGVRRWSHLYGWLPRLGSFVGREEQIPIDFDQILAAAAPRPMLVMAPTRDWHTTHADVVAAVSAAQALYVRYDGAGKLTLQSPDRWLEFNRSMQAQTADWLHSRAASNRPANSGR
jgi:poly(3-hydroxybutyrate) depolymerase